MRHINLIYLLIAFTFGCSHPKETVVTKWEDGKQQVTYKVSKGTINSPIDFEYKLYYPDGKSIFKGGQFKDGKEQGQWTFYYQSGKVRSMGNFQGGIMNGDFVAYYESGEIEQRGLYENGQIKQIEMFKRDGSTKETREDLTALLRNSPTPWTEEEKAFMITDCQMPMMTVYQNARLFCNCMIDSTANHTNYSDFASLTEHQRAIVFGYFITNNQSCTGILIKK